MELQRRTAHDIGLVTIKVFRVKLLGPDHDYAGNKAVLEQKSQVPAKIIALHSLTHKAT